MVIKYNMLLYEPFFLDIINIFKVLIILLYYIQSLCQFYLTILEIEIQPFAFGSTVIVL